MELSEVAIYSTHMAEQLAKTWDANLEFIDDKVDGRHAFIGDKRVNVEDTIIGTALITFFVTCTLNLSDRLFEASLRSAQAIRQLHKKGKE